MFIELTEILECPGGHASTSCVLATAMMKGRRVVHGTLGCPSCESEYPVVEGAVEFGPDPLLSAGARADDLTQEPIPAASDVAALLALEGAGGYVVLLGSACRIVADLGTYLTGVHFVGVNPPPDVHEFEQMSIVRSPRSLPVRDGMVRGVVVGREYAVEPWLAEGGRVLLKGLRLVVVGESAEVPGVEEVASGRGLWVGSKLGA